MKKWATIIRIFK